MANFKKSEFFNLFFHKKSIKMNSFFCCENNIDKLNMKSRLLQETKYFVLKSRFFKV